MNHFHSASDSVISQRLVSSTIKAITEARQRKLALHGSRVNGMYIIIKLFAYIVQHNTFQAVVITNGTKTYTVFTYHCDDINWANGNSTVIGFNAGGTSYENHPFSGTPDASDIDCESYPPSLWNNLVYDVNPLGSNSSILPPREGTA